jgi:NAD(P)-dependent dehydrogenase (short-subunit alcohol dehydrogenase family)
MAGPLSLAGKVAVVTGGTRGLGRAMAEAFAVHGADVVVASRKADACASVASHLAKTSGRNILGIPFHAGHWADADRLTNLTYGHFGRCDILVNNAGMSPKYPSLVDVSEDLFHKVLNVNFAGPFRLSVLMGQRMFEGEGGSIINISSIAAVQPGRDELVYACAKAAVNALTIGIARSFAPKVRCNAIMPGPFLTDVTNSWDMEEFNRTAADKIPLGRAGLPEEVVGAALYLASPSSSYTTGAIIKIDGGMAFTPG